MSSIYDQYTYDELSEDQARLVKFINEACCQNVRFRCNQRITEFNYGKEKDDFWKSLSVVPEASKLNEALDAYFECYPSMRDLNNGCLGMDIGEKELDAYTVVNFHQSAPFDIMDGTDLLHKVVLPPFDYFGDRVHELDVYMKKF